MPQRPLTPEDLLARGPLRRLGRRVAVLGEIDSTNAHLLRNAVAFGDGAVAAAELQTAGRGRLGRRWEAPRGAAVLLSVLVLEPPDSPLRSDAALVAAVAAAEALDETTDCAPVLRWPNDLAVHGRKLGGVLAESAMLPDGRCAFVLGIGLNCLQQRGHFAPELRAKATSLELECRHPIDRAAVAAAVLARLDAQLAQPVDRPALLAAWRARCADLGARVTLTYDGRSYAGTAVDLSETGDLIVQLDTGGRSCFAAAATTRLW